MQEQIEKFRKYLNNLLNDFHVDCWDEAYVKGLQESLDKFNELFPITTPAVEEKIYAAIGHSDIPDTPIAQRFAHYLQENYEPCETLGAWQLKGGVQSFTSDIYKRWCMRIGYIEPNITTSVTDETVENYKIVQILRDYQGFQANNLCKIVYTRPKSNNPNDGWHTAICIVTNVSSVIDMEDEGTCWKFINTNEQKPETVEEAARQSSFINKESWTKIAKGYENQCTCILNKVGEDYFGQTGMGINYEKGFVSSARWQKEQQLNTPVITNPYTWIYKGRTVINTITNTMITLKDIGTGCSNAEWTRLEDNYRQIDTIDKMTAEAFINTRM